MHKFCEMNQDKGMVTQIHYGAFRDANLYLYRKLGELMWEAMWLLRML